MDSYIENLLFFTEELSKQISLFDEVKTIEQIVSTCETQFNDFKKDLINKTEELNNTKNNFFSEMEKTEISTYEYYYLDPKYNQNIPDKFKGENIIHITEGEMNMKILDTKELENRYKEKINEGRNKEKKFVENSKFHSENIKKSANELMEKMKKLVLNILMALKNNFKLPEIEINMYLPKLIKLDQNIKLDEIIEKHFINQKIGKFLFNAEIYDMKVFKKIKRKKDNKIIIEEIEDKIVELEDGLGKTLLINDQISLLTIEKMKIFDLINIKELNLDIEKEKMSMDKITIKLLSNIKNEEIIKNELDITQEELDLIQSNLEKHHNRIIFLQKLSKFRVLGNYYISKALYTILSKYFIQILNEIKKDNDMFSAKNVIVLSQTYYIKENENEENKIYLQEAIKDHELFKETLFWENLFNFFMSKEIQKLRRSTYMKDKKEEEEKSHYGKLAFGQIMTICNNMKDFGFNKEDINKIIQPKIEYYKLDENLINNIKIVLDSQE